MLHRHLLCATVCSVAMAILASPLSSLQAQGRRAHSGVGSTQPSGIVATPSVTASTTTTSGTSLLPSTTGILAGSGADATSSVSAVDVGNPTSDGMATGDSGGRQADSGDAGSADSSGDGVDPWESRYIRSRSGAGKLNPVEDGSHSRASADSSGGGLDFFRMLLALLFVLTLIIAVAYVMRRLRLGGGRINSRGGIEILSRSAINGKQSLCLVRCANRLLVVGVSPNHIAALDRIDDADEIARVVGLAESAGPQSISNTFSRLFGREVEEYDTDETAVQAEQAELYDPQGDQWSQASHELTGLLDKVKGVKRICLRSHDAKQ